MKLVQKRSRKTGLPPGTLVHIGEKKPAQVTITAFNYTGARCDERQDLAVDGLAPPTDQSITWVDVGGSKLRIKHLLGVPFDLLKIHARYNARPAAAKIPGAISPSVKKEITPGVF